jgi:hypothetical protein
VSSGSEQSGFIFSLAFIVVFSMLLATIPVGLQGPGETPTMVIPVDPNLISDFSSTSGSFVRSDFSGSVHLYDLGGRNWACVKLGDTEFSVEAKVLVGGVLWLGGLDVCNFISSTGTNYGTLLTIAEIQADATGGTVRYSLQYSANGNSAGGFLAYWNTTLYSQAHDAWMANKLYLLHGVGVGSTANMNILMLLMSLLTLQLPNVPLLVNLLIAVPIWAGVIYLIWYIIKETLPFV